MLKAWSRSPLALALLFSVATGALFLWLEGLRQISAPYSDGVAGASEILETFRDPPSLEPWLGSRRDSDGNANSHYVQALQPFRADSTAETQDLTVRLDEALPYLESAAHLRQCIFTGDVYPVLPGLLSTEIVDLPALWNLLDALRQRARARRLERSLEEAANLLVLGLSVGDHFQQEPSQVYLSAGLRVQADLFPELAAIEAERGNTARVELAVERAAWVTTAKFRVQAAVQSFGLRSSSTSGISQLRRLAQAPELPAGLRGEIVVALSYGHLWHWRGRLLGPNRHQAELLKELGREADPVLARILPAAQDLHKLGFFERLRSIETLHALGPTS